MIKTCRTRYRKYITNMIKESKKIKQKLNPHSEHHT